MVPYNVKILLKGCGLLNGRFIQTVLQESYGTWWIGLLLSTAVGVLLTVD